MAKLYADPYNFDEKGFYFESYEELQAKLEAHPCDDLEYEIVYIDGDNEQLFDAVSVCASNIGDWFNTYDHLSDDDVEGMLYLIEHCGYEASEAFKCNDDVCFYDGTPSDYAFDLINECYNLEDFVLRYFDYDAFGRDLELGGDIVEVGFERYVVNANDF